MVEVVADLVIRAPVDGVVAVLLDADLAPAWTDGLDRLDVVSGTPGEPGCVGHAHYRGAFGRETVLTDTLEEVDPGRYFRSRIEGGGMRAVVETVLEPTVDGTDVRLRWRGTASSLFGTLTMRILRHRIQRRAEADLGSLARLVEARFGYEPRPP